MVGITYVYIDTIFGIYGHIDFVVVVVVVFFFTIFAGCLSMIVWTHALFGVLYVLYFSICTCSGKLSIFHMDRCSKHTIISFINAAGWPDKHN